MNPTTSVTNIVAQSANERVDNEDGRMVSDVKVSKRNRNKWFQCGDAQLDVDTATDQKT